MIAVIGAGVFSIVIVLSFLIVCGFPLGELTMGGQYKVFPKKLLFVGNKNPSKLEASIITSVCCYNCNKIWMAVDNACW